MILKILNTTLSTQFEKVVTQTHLRHVTFQKKISLLKQKVIFRGIQNEQT